MKRALSPTVQIAVHKIQERIHSGTYRYGSVLPPELDLAESIEVSRGTIRRALEELIERGEISKRANSRPIVGRPKGTASCKNGNEVHVWVSHPISDEPTLRFIRGISRGFQGTTVRIVVREPSRFQGAQVASDELEFLRELLSNQNAIGAIIQRDAYADNSPIMQRIIEAGKHLVFVDSPPPLTIQGDHVGSANIFGARAGVEHLISLGHRNIVCIADSDTPMVVQSRIEGFWRAMKLHGLEENASCIVGCHTPKSDIPNYASRGIFSLNLKKGSYFGAMTDRIMHEFFKLTPRPTGIFVAYDILAFFIAAKLEAADISIPEEVAIVGFDWLARWNDFGPDILTTVAQNFEGFGNHAANLILDRMTGDLPLLPRQVLLDAPLVVRSSTVPDAVNRFPRNEINRSASSLSIEKS